MGKDENKAVGGQLKEVSKMANNIVALNAELLGILTNSANLDATTKTKIGNAFATVFATEYATFLAGASNTAAKRGEFAISKTFGYWRKTVEDASAMANATLPLDTIV